LFALTVIGSLAIGIAASAAIFGLADALFLRPLPGVVDESRLVDVGRATNGQGFDDFGYQLLLTLQRATLLEGLAGFRLDASDVSLDNGRGGAARAYATPVTANYFAVPGSRAAAGRLFIGEEDRVCRTARPWPSISHAFARGGAAGGLVGTGAPRRGDGSSLGSEGRVSSAGRGLAPNDESASPVFDEHGEHLLLWH
jgi:hypothetical protein